jgi:hypothetical protein
MPDLKKRTKWPAKGEGGAIFQRNDKKMPSEVFSSHANTYYIVVDDERTPECHLGI